MIAVIQRVLEAHVSVAGRTVGQIGPGLLALVAIEKGDARPNAVRMIERLLGYRVFADADGRMNRSLAETGGDLLLISQFTLAADTDRGMRPSFTPAAAPADATRLFDELLALARTKHPRVASGEFGADMTVSLVNHGPVTFHLSA